MFESKTPLRETEAAILFARFNAARPASFRHDTRSAFRASRRAGSSHLAVSDPLSRS
jgi:hypothetical protein